MYRKRCQAEVLEAARTRFMTFTFRPSVHREADRVVLSSIEAELAAPSRHYDDPHLREMRAIASALTRADESELSESLKELLFRKRSSVLYKHVQAFMKRLRTNTGSKVRYCIVAEPHSKELAGRPHFHMLLHEIDPNALVVKDDIRNAWNMRIGLMKMNVVNDENSRYIGYLTKYLTKTTIGRVVCSVRYGESALTGQPQARVRPEVIVCGVPEGSGEPGCPEEHTTDVSRGATGDERFRPLSSSRLAVSLEETWDVGPAPKDVAAERRGKPDLLSPGETVGFLYEHSLIGAPSEWSAKLRDERAFKALMDQYGPDMDLSRRRRRKGDTLH